MNITKVQTMSEWFGKLTLEDFKHGPIESGAGISMAVGGLVVLFLLFYYNGWKWLWREYLTSLDHKKIGIMYIVMATLMLFKGLVDAAMMRAQQAMSVG